MERPILISISGSHLYGIPNPEDIDLRGIHLLNKEQFWKNWGKGRPSFTIESVGKFQGLDLVSYELQGFMKEMAKPNVNFLEIALSPIRLIADKNYNELQNLARDCVSKKMLGHWQGFSKHTSYHAVQEGYTKPKRNLYLVKIYLQGIYASQTGKLKSNLNDFKELSEWNDDLIQELFQCKIEGKPFSDKQKFLDYCSFLEKTMEQQLKSTKELREEPSLETKKAIQGFTTRVYEEEFGWDNK